MSKSTSKPAAVKARPVKPQKPYDGFPLFPHATGRWAKKIRGKFVYFGPWGDPDAALSKYLDERDDLHAGRTPRTNRDGTIRDLLNRFLTAKRHLVDTREITPRTFADYNTTTDRLIEAFGKMRLVDDLASDDFESLRASLAKTRGPVALGNEIQRIRVVFKYAYDASLVDKPIRYGPTFKRPSKKVLRKARNEKGPRMFEAAQIQTMLAAASPQLRAMILLGINCGFGNHDVGTLPQRALDLKRGWVDYPRPKTGILRRCPLWKETVAAIREGLVGRPAPKNPDHADRVFITKYGHPWANETASSPVGKETTKLIIDEKVHRPGLGFYALRHTFETIAGGSKDQVAVDHIMGHARDDMPSLYRERIDDKRLQSVAQHVRKWLFAKPSLVTA